MLLRISVLISCLAVASAGAPFSSLYFFGDSLTDTGNVLNATSILSTYSFCAVSHVAARLDRVADAAPAGISTQADSNLSRTDDVADAEMPQDP